MRPRVDPIPLPSPGRRAGSIILTSNLPFARWGDTFSDDIIAAAMIDRLVHHAEVLTLDGDSYRTRQRQDLLAKQDRGGAIFSRR